MELAPDPELNEAQVIMIMCSKIEQIIYKWIENDEIEGIHTKEHLILKDNLKAQAQEWAFDNRVIFKKNVNISETHVNLKTNRKVFQSHSN